MVRPVYSTSSINTIWRSSTSNGNSEGRTLGMNANLAEIVAVEGNVHLAERREDAESPPQPFRDPDSARMNPDQRRIGNAASGQQLAQLPGEGFNQEFGVAHDKWCSVDG